VQEAPDGGPVDRCGTSAKITSEINRLARGGDRAA
jgi:hypothetical protein